MEKFTTHFTYPGGRESHLRFLADLVAGAPRGAVIRGLISHFDDSGESIRLLEAFVAAADRDVNTYLIIRTGQPALRYFSESPNWVRVAAGEGALNETIHTKLLTVSESRIAGRVLRDVSAFGSATWTHTSTKKHQNTVVVSDADFYQGCMHYWAACAHSVIGAPGGGPAYETEFKSSRGVVKAYCYPFPGRNLVRELTDRMRSGAHPTTAEPACLTLALAEWDVMPKSNAIFTSISRFVTSGGRLRVALRVGPNSTPGARIESLRQLRARYPRQVQIWKGKEGARSDLHHKYFMYSGRYGAGSAWERLVWTGSPNWTGAAWNDHDEFLAKIRDDEVYMAFELNFLKMTDEYLEVVP